MPRRGSPNRAPTLHRRPNAEEHVQMGTRLSELQADIETHRYKCLVNDSTDSLKAGLPVILKSNGRMDSPTDKAMILGLLTEDTASLETGYVQVEGELTLTEDQWNQVLPGGLTIGSPYFDIGIALSKTTVRIKL